MMRTSLKIDPTRGEGERDSKLARALIFLTL
jgi:hypothetical protein